MKVLLLLFAEVDEFVDMMEGDHRSGWRDPFLLLFAAIGFVKILLLFAGSGGLLIGVLGTKVVVKDLLLFAGAGGLLIGVLGTKVVVKDLLFFAGVRDFAGRVWGCYFGFVNVLQLVAAGVDVMEGDPRSGSKALLLVFAGVGGFVVVLKDDPVVKACDFGEFAYWNY